ncbi:tol-pal system protein YbgF [Rhodoferax sp.]|uniref:tol-pal system protein YbgF n=1 Tax=Rhodoferax sp. TaxID=50421 RepID=UPI00276026D8|nr:tol-pal system protein YbgF [Rhodoferax sp.]
MLHRVFRESGRYLAALVLTVGAASAGAGLFDDDEARKAILDLRERVDAVRTASEARIAQEGRRLNEDNAQLRKGMLELQNQIETLRAELAKLRGQDEQLQREIVELQRRQKEMTQGVEERLRQFEPTKVVVDGIEFVADPSERRDFEAALATFRRGAFPAAQTAFFDFLKRFPQSGYAPTALFWLGNAQYANRDYRDAITNFRALLSRAPDHFRAPEAMLSIANCQIELKETKAARKTLEDLLKIHPKSEAAPAAKERLSHLK